MNILAAHNFELVHMLADSNRQQGFILMCVCVQLSNYHRPMLTVLLVHVPDVSSRRAYSSEPECQIT